MKRVPFKKNSFLKTLLLATLHPGDIALQQTLALLFFTKGRRQVLPSLTGALVSWEYINSISRFSNLDMHVNNNYCIHSCKSQPFMIQK